jgi:hypothetical protein
MSFLAGKIIMLSKLHLLVLLGKQVDFILAGKNNHAPKFTSTRQNE